MGVSECHCLYVLRGCIHSDGDGCAFLAIDLHNEGDRLLEERFGIRLRPSGVDHELRMPELCPEGLGDMRYDGGE